MTHEVLDDCVIEDFYCKHQPVLLPNSKFRHFRLKTKRGFLKVNRTIRNAKDLQFICIKYKPIAVYCTNSYWLDQRLKLGRRAGRHPIFLGLSFVIDFDDKDEANIQKAIDFFHNKGFEKILRVKTGRGFHLHILDWEKDIIKHADPIKREYQYLKAMRKTAKAMVAAGIKFDFPISVDTRRLIRVPNTLHMNGTTITLVPLMGEGNIVSRPMTLTHSNEDMASELARCEAPCIPAERGPYLPSH